MNQHDVESQLNIWLNDQANEAQIPDQYRDEFIWQMRKTTGFASLRLRLQVAVLRDEMISGLPKWIQKWFR